MRPKDLPSGESPGSGDDLSPASQQLWVRRPHGRGERHDTGQRASLRRYGNLGGIRQWIESVYGTVKDQLSLERHGGRTRAGVFARIAQRLLALAACIGHNWSAKTTGLRSLTGYDH